MSAESQISRELLPAHGIETERVSSQIVDATDLKERIARSELFAPARRALDQLEDDDAVGANNHALRLRDVVTPCAREAWSRRRKASVPNGYKIEGVAENARPYVGRTAPYIRTS
jgi:hypothetical protein